MTEPSRYTVPPRILEALKNGGEPYPFTGNCARCEDTGVTHFEQPSAVSPHYMTTYAMPCKCTAHGQPMMAMLNRRFQSRPDAVNILTSTGIYQGEVKAG